MSTYQVSIITQDEPMYTNEENVEAAHFFEEKGWILFVQNNRRVAAYQAGKVLSVTKVDKECCCGNN
jgi:hypothetical protein